MLTASGRSFAMSKEERRQAFERWASAQTKFATLPEAASALPFKLRVPSNSLAGTPSAIYVSRDTPPQDRSACVVFGDPVESPLLYATPSAEHPDFHRSVRQDAQDHSTGVSAADTTSVIVAVEGMDARASGPGYNLIDGAKYDRPGFVTWWEGGVLYDLYGTRGAGGTPLRDLVAIAESMYEGDPPAR